MLLITSFSTFEGHTEMVNIICIGVITGILIPKCLPALYMLHDWRRCLPYRFHCSVEHVPHGNLLRWKQSYRNSEIKYILGQFWKLNFMYNNYIWMSTINLPSFTSDESEKCGTSGRTDILRLDHEVIKNYLKMNRAERDLFSSRRWLRWLNRLKKLIAMRCSKSYKATTNKVRSGTGAYTRA